MIAARVATQIHTIELALEGAPEIADAFGERARIAGLRLTYTGHDRKVSAIRFKTADDMDLFVSDEDMTPEKWPSWLRELIDQYRPAEARGECPQCSAPAVGDRIPTHIPRCPWNDPNF
ncbi:hypothetical protein [Streptomyces capuensis]|uniref:hypothetical protein n=1 Tax=Streptomyces capuensis TaxID=1464056 RepID=UPI0004BF69E7|nr:hypothetical protein [Streptomyces capuensis]